MTKNVPDQLETLKSWDTKLGHSRLLNTDGDKELGGWRHWKIGKKNRAETLAYPIGERLDTLKTWKDIRQFRQLSIQQLVILQSIGHKWADIMMDSW